MCRVILQNEKPSTHINTSLHGILLRTYKASSYYSFIGFCLLFTFDVLAHILNN